MKLCKLAISLAVVGLVSTPVTTSAETPEQWRKLADEANSIYFDCIEKQTIHALESNGDSAAFITLVRHLCKEQMKLLIRAWIETGRAAGRSDDEIKTAISNVLGDIISRTTSIFEDLRQKRRTTMK